MFLLETSTIEDVIVNSTALAFVLTLDELIFTTLSADATKFMMNRLNGFPVKTQEEMIDLNDEDAVLERSSINFWCTSRLLVVKAPLVVALWLATCGFYYMHMCRRAEDGTWISVPVHTPLSSAFNLLSALSPEIWPIPSTEEPYWPLPGVRY